MASRVICISGGIGSGKTSLTKLLAERLGVPRGAFGDVVRATARERGIAEDREALQQLGAELIETLGWEPFCRAVLDAAAWDGNVDVVIDGVRHVAAIETIRKLVAPNLSVLFFVDTPEDVRRQRIGAREGADPDLRAIEQHSTEADVRSALRSSADLVLNGEHSPDSLVEELLQFLGGA